MTEPMARPDHQHRVSVVADYEGHLRLDHGFPLSRLVDMTGGAQVDLHNREHVHDGDFTVWVVEASTGDGGPYSGTRTVGAFTAQADAEALAARPIGDGRYTMPWRALHVYGSLAAYEDTHPEHREDPPDPETDPDREAYERYVARHGEPARVRTAGS